MVNTPTTQTPGRAALSNKSGRYERQSQEVFDDGWGTMDVPAEQMRTEVTEEAPKSIIARNTSPDIPFDRSINPYRGCEHGCIYCFARPTHAYLGLSPGLDFETKLFAKPNAAELLRSELSRKGYRCAPIAMGTNTDPYQPVEKRYEVMRRILQVLAEFNHPVTIVTKSHLVCRDLDILGPMGRAGLAKVALSVTTLDRHLARKMEPRASTPEKRIDAITQLAMTGVPVGVMVAPVIPALTDHEMESILEKAAGAGAQCANFILLRLPLEIKDLFTEWLSEIEPAKAKRVMSLLVDMRGGRANDPRFGHRMRGQGKYAELLSLRFARAKARLGLTDIDMPLDCTQFEIPTRNDTQLTLF